MSTKVSTEITFTFWIRGENSHEYRVHQYTEFLETEIRGRVYRESGKQYYLTDGGDSVSHLGGTDFYIPNLDIMAKWLKEDTKPQKVEVQVPGLFMGFKEA